MANLLGEMAKKKGHGEIDVDREEEWSGGGKMELMVPPAAHPSDRLGGTL